MLKIKSLTGDLYEFDPVDYKIYKNGVVQSSSTCEPIFSKNNKEDEAPEFTGILLKNSNKIVTMTGNINDLTNNPEEIY